MFVKYFKTTTITTTSMCTRFTGETNYYRSRKDANGQYIKRSSAAFSRERKYIK